MNSIRRPGREDSVEVDYREKMTSKCLVLTNEAEKKEREGTSKQLGSKEGMVDTNFETAIAGMWLLRWSCSKSQSVASLAYSTGYHSQLLLNMVQGKWPIA